MSHTLVHHQIYKGDATYALGEGKEPEHVAMDWWALFLMVAFHLPFFGLIQRVTHIPSLWGGVAAIVVYYTIYESFHWAMHVPRTATFLGRFRAYRFLETHHKVHHKYMLSNLNVIFPLADLTMGTLRDGTGKKTTWREMLRRRIPAAKPAEGTEAAKPVVSRQEAAWRPKKPTRV